MHIRSATLLFAVAWASAFSPLAAAGDLQPWPENPWYWSYDGEPILLVGGSDDDNLFQWPADKLEAQLDEIAAAGGNVVRNTMSDRPDRGWEVYAYHLGPDGRYDLGVWNPDYWTRFERFLKETDRRQIFVQIELWDRFDYTDDRSQNWQLHPYNPQNNVNYRRGESGFAKRYPDHPGRNRQTFFFTTPEQRNNLVVLKYQQRFIDRLLETSLDYDRVLYCIDNETSGEEAWSTYWACYIRQRAAEKDKQVMITEMWDDWDLTAERHARTFDHPQRYDYVDVSQNTHRSGQVNWDNFIAARTRLAAKPRPMNTTKIYGRDGNKFGHTSRDAVERFWRHLLAGAASARFHRPPAGLGISDLAQGSLRSVRMLEKRVRLWDVEPATDQLRDREENEAFLAARPGKAYVVFFPAAGEVTLKLDPSPEQYEGAWLNLQRPAWEERYETPPSNAHRIKNASDRPRVLVLSSIQPLE